MQQWKGQVWLSIPVPSHGCGGGLQAPARYWEGRKGGGGGVGGGPTEQLHSDTMQQRTTNEWKEEVGWVGVTDVVIRFRNYV